MHRRILSLALFVFLSIVIVNWSCTKIDTTTLGGDLIPTVDNVNTFADTLAVEATQSDFDDTTIVANTDLHALGNINNDPLFGKVSGDIFLQLKPQYFPLLFGPKDSIPPTVDSVILCLSYQYFWGDSTIPQKIRAYEVTDNRFFYFDSIYRKNWNQNSNLILASLFQIKRKLM